MINVPFQHEFRPEIPIVYGAKDYREFKATLIKIDEILGSTKFERNLIARALACYAEANKIDAIKFAQSKRCINLYPVLRHALRCNIARHLTGDSYRQFSIRLSDSNLLRWFVGIGDFSKVKAISKSSLERYEKYFDEETVADFARDWLAETCTQNQAIKIGLAKEIECTSLFIDSTCAKANIHFPVDWVLLKDAARSLLLAIKTIRKQGLKNRMVEPEVLLKQMNKLCIKMTHSRRKSNSKKQRKYIFREMKRLSHCIAKHATKYRNLLNNEWRKTNWSYNQAQQVIRRIETILEKLPAAIKQAHERIIGGRLVPAAEKILSLYDDDAHVIIRGKAGYEIEFGLGLLLTEQINGLILDWRVLETSTADNKLLIPALERMEKHYGKSKSVCTDRGFDDQKNNSFLQEKNIINAICPKSPKKLLEKLSDDNFADLQTRRGQTEARIGIFKNIFLGKPLRSRITLCKKIAIGWCVIAHNLWVLSRMALDHEKTVLKKAA